MGGKNVFQLAVLQLRKTRLCLSILVVHLYVMFPAHEIPVLEARALAAQLHKILVAWVKVQNFQNPELSKLRS